MTKLTDVVHFRGETVTLYATFKNLDATPEATGVGVILPKVQIEYVDNAKQVVQVLPPTDMIPISKERFYYRWTIPYDIPLTTYWAIYSGFIGGVEAFRTEEIKVGNPAITKNSCILRYGSVSVLNSPPVYPDRKHPALPKGEF